MVWVDDRYAVPRDVLLLPLWKIVIRRINKNTQGLLELFSCAVVYSKFSALLGCDLVVSFVWITRPYTTTIIFIFYLKSNLSSLTCIANQKKKKKNCLQNQECSFLSYFWPQLITSLSCTVTSHYVLHRSGYMIIQRNKINKKKA